MESLNLRDLRRIEYAKGSHIEPPLDQGWSDLDKLRWNARVVEVDCDLPAGWFDIREHKHQYAVCYPGMGGMHETFHMAWRRLVHLGEGARMAAVAARYMTRDDAPNGAGLD